MSPTAKSTLADNFTSQDGSPGPTKSRSFSPKSTQCRCRSPGHRPTRQCRSIDSLCARIALEQQPVDSWRAQASSLSNPQSKITFAVALARAGKATDQAAIHQMLSDSIGQSCPELKSWNCFALTNLASLAWERCAGDTKLKIVRQLDSHFPTPDEDTLLNRELASVDLSRCTFDRRTLCATNVYGSVGG